jgi:hypothetical protein
MRLPNATHLFNFRAFFSSNFQPKFLRLDEWSFVAELLFAVITYSWMTNSMLLLSTNN